MTEAVLDDAGEMPADPAGRPRRQRGFRVFVRDVLVILLIAVVASFLIKTFLIRSFYIPSESMVKTLQVDDRIIVNQLEPRFIPIQRGDVVVFTDPGNWLEPVRVAPQAPLVKAVDTVLGVIGLSAPDSNDHLVKRVIGLPGDRVECCDDKGRLLINGEPIDEPYIELPTTTANASPTDFDITVPQGSLWVMGDNRDHSGDSAYHHATDPGREFVPVENVVGRAVLVSWPLPRWSVLDNYASVFATVPAVR